MTNRLTAKKDSPSRLANSRFALTEVTAYSEKDESRRSFSAACLLNARTTRTPVMFSSSTALILSSSFCSLRKSGDVLRMIPAAAIVMTTSTASSTRPISQSFMKASARDMTNTTGTGNIICRHPDRANCMFVISETVRVVTEATPNVRKSATERSSDFAYRASRMSFPTRDVRAAQAYPLRMPPAPEMTAVTAMTTAVLVSMRMVAPPLPSLSISAASVGIISAPATSTMSRTIVRMQSFQCGLRKRKISLIHTPCQ